MTPIAMVFDELKDYLSESDLSLDYKIARSRSKKKKVYRNSRIFANSTEYSHQGTYISSTYLDNYNERKNKYFLEKNWLCIFE